MLSSTAVLFVAMLWPSQAPANAPAFRQLTMEQAASHALALKPGSVIGSAFVRGHKRLKYVFEIESTGGIWRVNVDADTGEVYRACIVDGAGRNACPSDHHRSVTHLKTGTSQPLGLSR